MSSDADIIIALARKLEAQNTSTLEAENATLRRERDQLKADAMSDLINRHRLENQVRNREAERDFLRAHNAALRAGQGRWPEGDDSPTVGQVPRVISAEELREGQHVCLYDAGCSASGAVDAVDDDWVYLVDDGSQWMLSEGDTIVLLEDAPTSDGDGDSEAEYPEQESRHFAPYGATNTLCGETVPRGVMWDLKAGEYADTRFTVHERKTTCPDCRVQIKWLPAGTPAPRLTVHALNTAPVGSTLTGPGLHRMTRTKLEDGRWWAHPGMSLAYGDTSEYMVSQHPDATLTHPEGDDHE